MNRRDAVARLGALFAAALVPSGFARGSDDLVFRAGTERVSPGLTDEVFPHPEPRGGITAANVLAESELPDKKRVRAVYAAAREHPAIFDGIYCTCHCVEDGHRSLLVCFETDQATGCWGCQEVAEEVAKQAKLGKSLKEIRAAVDKRFIKASRGHH